MNAAANESGGRRPFASQTILHFLGRYTVVFFLGGMVLLYTLLLPDIFPTVANFRTITTTQVPLILISLALLIPFAAGEFDLSFGAVAGLSSTLVALLIANEGWPLGLAILIVVATGIVIGFINAFFVVYVGVNSFITTLGTGTIIFGLTIGLVEAEVLILESDVLVTVVNDRLFGLPYAVYYGLFLTVVVWYIFRHTPLGRYTYFTGEGPDVARLTGLPVKAIKTGAFVVCGALSAVAGVVLLGLIGSADPNVGRTFLLPAFSAVFLGAATITPGRVNAIGTLVAAYVLVVGITGIQLLGGAGWYEQVFNGGVLVISVSFAELLRRRRTG